MATEEIRSMRDILRNIENRQIEMHSDIKNYKEKTEDQEVRLRKAESELSKVKNGLWGILVASGTGLIGGIKALLGGH